MADHWQLALSAGPLALYFLTLAAWHGGRRPRVLWGPIDLAFLFGGIGGLALFGPIGQTIARVIFGRPSFLSWLALGSGMALVALALSRGSWRRLVVYHADPATLEKMLRDCLERAPGRFVRTLRGFEDRDHARGLLVQPSRWSPTVLVEAYGNESETLIHALARELDRRLRNVAVPTPPVAWLFLACSAICVTVPLAGWVLRHPGARDAIRTLIERLPGG